MAMKQTDAGVASFFRMRRLPWRKFRWFKIFPLEKAPKKIFLWGQLSMSLLCLIFTLFLHVALWIKERWNTYWRIAESPVVIKKSPKKSTPSCSCGWVQLNWTSLSIILFLLANFTFATAFPMSSLLTTMPPSEILSANLEITHFSGIFPAG